ncbi:ABC transporter permease subunit [Methanocella sp. MCL-LM]|uniref:ABC transporter permease subunit n=1 Tax=Methanocella sp. MCL-LM TaxID=3412035 RepID=UPI003C71A09D
MRSELIVAAKEFRDHLTSKRFILIFAVLMLVCIYSMVNGMGDYQKQLDQYKKSAAENPQQPWYQEQVAMYQKMIADAEASGAPQEEIDSLKFQLEQLTNPPMPSVLFVFQNLNQYFALIGMVLAVSMGFDLISREKEEGSLKSLLSHPVYRDSIINGKTLGAFGVLGIVLGATFLITMAIMLIYGVIPQMNDLMAIAVYFVMALLYCLVFFALAMMTSTLAKSSSMSVMYVLGVIIFLIVLSMFSYNITQLILGPPPEYSGPIYYAEPMPMPVDEKMAVSSVAVDATSDNVTIDRGDVGILPMPPVDDQYQQAWQQYYERQTMIIQAIDSISPMSNFQNHIAPAIFNQGFMIYRSALSSYKPYYPQQVTLWDSLASVWVNILVLLIETMIAFAVAYVKFLRVDVR